MRKHLARRDICSCTQGFHLSPDVAPVQGFACPGDEYRAGLNALPLSVSPQLLAQDGGDKDCPCFQGYTMKQAMDEVKMVVEGVYSAKAAIALARKYEVAMPIIEEINHVLFDDKPAKDAVRELMLRDRREEHSSLEWEE